MINRSRVVVVVAAAVCTIASLAVGAASQAATDPASGPPTETPDLRVAVSAPDTVHTDERFAIVVEVFNDGASADDGWSFTVEMSSPPTFQAVDDGCSVTASGFSCGGVAIAPGSSGSFVMLTETRSPGTTTITVTLEHRDVDLDDDTVEADIVVTADPPDLALRLDGPWNAESGTDVLYAVHVSNLGLLDSATQTISLSGLPAGARLSEGSAWGGTCGPVGDELVCTYDDGLAGGGSYFFHVAVEAPPESGEISVRGVIDDPATDDPNPENDSATWSTSVFKYNDADLAIAVDGPAGASIGETVTYTVTVDNEGSGASAGTTVAVAGADGFSLPPIASAPDFCDVGSLGLSCALPDLSAGGSRSFEFSVVATETFRFSATADSDDTERDMTDNTVVVMTSVSATGEGADLELVTNVADTVTAGESITFEFTVTNLGPEETGRWLIGAYNFDALVDATTTTDGCLVSRTEADFECRGQQLAVGQSVTVSFTATAPDRPTTLSLLVGAIHYDAEGNQGFDPNEANSLIDPFTVEVVELPVDTEAPVITEPPVVETEPVVDTEPPVDTEAPVVDSEPPMVDTEPPEMPVGLLLEASELTVDQGASVTFTAIGIDGSGSVLDEVTDQVELASDVDTDVVDGDTVTFPTASPHTITATHPGGATASITVDVIPPPGASTPRAADPPTNGELPATGVGWSPIVVVAGLLLCGGFVVTWRRRAPASPGK